MCSKTEAEGGIDHLTAGGVDDAIDHIDDIADHGNQADQIEDILHDIDDEVQAIPQHRLGGHQELLRPQVLGVLVTRQVRGGIQVFAVAKQTVKSPSR